MRILIAEDDSALASFVKKGLSAEHYAVDVSNDGEQARSMAGEFEYDLVVLDLNLPHLDGVTILRYLRTRKPSMPILVLTGRTRVEDRVQCLDLGADDYLAKPFSFSELSARIRALLRRAHLPAESVLTVEDLKLDRVERRVERAGSLPVLTHLAPGALLTLKHPSHQPAALRVSGCEMFVATVARRGRLRAAQVLEQCHPEPGEKYTL